MSSSALTLILLPFVTALIGWITNWTAIRMLFRPRKALKIGPWLTFQGLIPRRQADLADKIATIVEAELINQHVIGEELSRLDLDHYIETFGRRLVRERLASRIGGIPLLAGLLPRIERFAIETLKEELPDLRHQISSQLEHHLQIRAMVSRRIAEFDVDRLESLVLATAKSEFRAIEFTGAILGFIIGLIQVALLLLNGR